MSEYTDLMKSAIRAGYIPTGEEFERIYENWKHEVIRAGLIPKEKFDEAEAKIAAENLAKEKANIFDEGQKDDLDAMLAKEQLQNAENGASTAVIPQNGEVIPKERRKRYNWDVAASLLARGLSAEDVAARLGCHRQSLFRAIRRSPGLRERIRKEKLEIMYETGAYIEGQRSAIADKLMQLAMEGDSRVLLFLAKKLDITSGHYNCASE